MAHGEKNPGIFEELNDQSLYTVANAIDWRALDERPRQIPETDAHGIDVAKRPIAAVAAYCRKRMHHRTSWIEITQYEEAASYTVNVEGNSLTVSSDSLDPLTELEILEAFRDEINSDATFSDVVEADLITRDPDAAERDTLRLRGVDPANYVASASADSGAEMTADQEATSFELEPFVWTRETGRENTNPMRWDHHAGLDVISVDWRGAVYLKVPVNAAQRLDFKVSGDDGIVYVFSGIAEHEEYRRGA